MSEEITIRVSVYLNNKPAYAALPVTVRDGDDVVLNLPIALEILPPAEARVVRAGDEVEE